MARKALGEYHEQLAISRGMEVRREEYLDHMTFKANTRPLFTEIFGPLIGLKEEWAAQGATAEELDFSAFRFRRPMSGGVPVSIGWRGGEEQRVIEDTDEHIIAIDTRGRTVKLCKGTASIPLPLDYPVKTRDDWERLKPRYAFSEDRLAEGWEETARQHIAEGRYTRVGIPGGFDEPRQLMGEEGVCMAFYDQPDLIRDMLETIGDTAEKVLDRVSSAVRIDALSVHEDMAGHSGSLVGPNQIREFILPYYRRAWDLVRSRGARIFDQDSDGDMNSVIPAFIDAGINVMHPCEPAAHMNIVKLREQYGTHVAFVGGIDKHVIRRSKDAIVAELEYKIPPMVASGGCMLGLDHRIPNGTPLDNYRFYIQKAWEILDREAAKL